MVALAEAAPRSGSVVQSANTNDAIEVEINNLEQEGSTTYTITNTRSGNGGWSVNSGDNPEIIPAAGPGFPSSVYFYDVNAEGGKVFVDFAVDENIGDDSDYLAAGIWAYVPVSGEPEIGIFVDSEDELRFNARNLNGLTGTAMYEGYMLGLYSEETQDPGEENSISGEVALTANFDTNTIQGIIDNLVTDFEEPEDRVEVLDVVITLSPAPIDTTQDGGFFSGTAEANNVDVDSAPNPVNFSGNWGGEFFVNGEQATDHPGNVAGTFGLADTADMRSIVGVFHAGQPDDS